MFGIGRKPRPNYLRNRIIKEIDYEIDHDRPSARTPLEVESYYYSDSRKNFSVTQEYLQALPMDWRRHWPYLDWEKVFPPEEPEEPISPDNPLSRVSRISETYQDLFKLNDEARARIKAIALSELKKSSEDEEE